MSSVDRIANTTNFNGQNLLDGSGTIGANGQSVSISSAQTTDLGNVTIGPTTYSLSDLANGGALDTTAGNTTNATHVLTSAISQIATSRGQIGAFSRETLQPQILQIAGQKEHLLDTVSMIRDTDFAAEISNQVRSQLLEKSSLLLLKFSQRQRKSTFSLLA